MKDFSSIVLLIAGAQGVMLSVALVLSQYRRSIAAAFLGCIIFVCGIELLNAWAIPTGYHSSSGAFPFWLLGSYWIIPAALWCFIKWNDSPGLRVNRKAILLFAPAFIEMIVEFSSFYIYRISGVLVDLMKYKAWVIGTEFLPVITMILVMFFFIKNVIENYKRTASVGKDLYQWYKMAGLCTMFLLFTILWSAEVFFQTNTFEISSGVIVFFLIGMGYVIYFKPDFFEVKVTPKIRSSDEHQYAYNDEHEMQKIVKLFTEEKIYLRPRLAIDELSAELNLPERYVSYLINKNEGTNFNQFVNSYRVKEFLARMRDIENNNKTLLGIALDSGFSSKSSFNQIFKSITGKTPSSYLSMHKNESKNTISDVRN